VTIRSGIISTPVDFNQRAAAPRMQSIPLFVTASGLLAAIAIGFALTLIVLNANYGRSHLRQWQWMWVALALYAVASGFALLAVNRPLLAPFRSAASLVALGAAWWHLASLDRGVRAFLGRIRSEAFPAWILIGVPILVAAFLVLTPVPGDPDERLARYYVRLIVLAVAWSATYLIAGVRLLRSAPGVSVLGQRILGGALVAYGALRIGEPFLHFVGPSPVLAQFVTFGGLPLLVAFGAGMLIALLDVERARAVDAAEASHAVRRAADEAEAALTAQLDRQRERFRSLIEHSSDIIFLLAPDATVEYVSPAVTHVLGWPPSELVGNDPFTYIHPEDRAGLRDALLRAFASDPTLPGGIPFRARHRDGSWVRVESVARVLDEPGRGKRLIVSARDVRERLRLETELISARRLESIGRLAGGIAHDFNNLLTAVLGNVALLRPHLAKDTEGSSHLDEIQQASRRGADLITRILAFARRQIVEPRSIDLGDQVRGLETLLRRLLPAHTVMEIEAPTPVWIVKADPTAVEQALVNLVVNARDAMPQGGRLRVTVSHETFGEAGHEDLGIPAGDWVRVDVSDTGVGIDEHHLGHVFEPFFTTKDASGGSGLGLATVFGSVTQAGGHVRVRSLAGRGATFSLFFPRARGSHDGETNGAAHGEASAANARARAGEVILLVEDEDRVRSVTARQMRDLGYQVLTAADGDEAASVAASHGGVIHALVSDLVMPGIGGVETAARIRRTRSRIGVVFISGFSEEALEWQGALPQGGRLLKKPFAGDELGAAVRAAIDAGTAN
jgi:PAS domain S-box-containing protein